MYKKILCAAVALTMCLCAAGCSDKDSSSVVSSSQADSSSAVETAVPESSSQAETTTSESSSQAETTTDSSSQPEPTEEEADITPAMWKVEGEKGNTVYFLGSMHALDDSCYPLPNEITDAYNASDSLAVECDIFAYMGDFAAQMELAQSMLYQDGTTIADHIDADLYESAKQILTDAGLYMPLYDMYNVTMWSSLIESAMMMNAGLDSTKGLDMQMLTTAHEEDKDIIEIESAEFQNELLYTQPDELNEFMLETYVYYYEDQCEELEKSFELWKAGDMKEYVETEDEFGDIDIEISDELQAMIDNYNKQLIDDRNKGMIEKAKDMIDGGQNVFYVVGAAHFYGETGILKGLEDAGYTVEEIQYD